MMNSPILFLVITLIAAVCLDYVLIWRWSVYRRLRDEKAKADEPVNKMSLIRRAFWGLEIHQFKLSIIAWFKIILGTPISYILVLIVVGIIQLRLQSLWMGAICTISGLVILGINLRSLNEGTLISKPIDFENPQVSQDAFIRSVKKSPPFSILISILISSLLIVCILFMRNDVKNKTTELLAEGFWAASVILGLIFALKRKVNYPSIFIRIKENKIELASLFLVIFLAFAIRIVDLPGHPYPWSGDEMSIGIYAKDILNGEITNLFDVGWALQPNWSFLPTVLTLGLLGETITAIRLVSVVAGTLAVLFTYLTARELFNPSIALLAGAFIATLPYNVHFSRIGVGNVMDSFMSALVFWLVAKIVKNNDLRLYYLAGAIGGLCLYTYAGTRLVPLLAIFFLLLIVFRQKKYQSAYWRNYFIFIWALIISALPEFFFLAQNPNNLMGRMNDEGIFFNGWIGQTGKSVLAILFEKLIDTSLAFIASPALGMFYNSPKPYLTMLGSVFFLVGMLYCIVNITKFRYFFVLFWFWVVVILGGVLTRPPAHTRLLMTTPAMAIMLGLGIYILVKYLQKLYGISKNTEASIMVLIVCVITCQQIYFYLVEYRNNVYSQDKNSEFAMEVGLIANNLGEEFQVFILGEPRLDSNFPTLAFLVPDNRRSDLNPGALATFKLPLNQKAVFFATPDNRALLGKFMTEYPGGSFSNFYRIANPKEILFEYYIFTP